MKKPILAMSLLAIAALPSCGTVHGARWAFGMKSIYPEPDSMSESVALRAAVGVPVIVGGVAFDAVTFPLQLLFGVWPWWGDESTQMNPNG